MLNLFQHLYQVNKILISIGMTNDERINIIPCPKLKTSPLLCFFSDVAMPRPYL